MMRLEKVSDTCDQHKVEPVQNVQNSRLRQKRRRHRVCWQHLSVGQLNGHRTLVALLDVGQVVLTGAVLGVLGVCPIQGVLVAGQHCVEV